MPVINGAYGSDDIEVENGSIVHHDTTHGAALITSAEVEPSDQLQLSSIDSQPARLRIHDSESIDGRVQFTELTFDTLTMARLALGLWQECGPFPEPEGDAIPVDVAVAGQETIAAYLRVNGGYPNPRRTVAARMGVAEGTVSNYCNRVRWDPAEQYHKDRVIKTVHDMDGEFSESELKNRVSAPSKITESVLGEMNRLDIVKQVDDEKERWTVIADSQ